MTSSSSSAHAARRQVKISLAIATWFAILSWAGLDLHVGWRIFDLIVGGIHLAIAAKYLRIERSVTVTEQQQP